MQESREHIQSRMLKNIARSWGFTETEAESNFDPLVSMLMGACATELEKISHEIHSSNARVMERIVQMLSPESLTGPLPSHAIANATPLETSSSVHCDMQFYTRLNNVISSNSQETTSKEIYFSPTASFRLNRASIKAVAVGGHLYKMEGLQREVVAYTSKGISPSTIWLGIDEPGVNLHQSLLYFHCQSVSENQLFYYHLPKAKWFYNESPLQMKAGYGQGEICGENFEVNGASSTLQRIFKKAKNQVNAYYERNFLTISDQNGFSTKDIQDGDNSILNHFEGKETELLKKQSLRWIRIQFPNIISNSLLQETSIIMNCFPVINRQLHELNYSLQEHINLVPLCTDNIFLDLEEVKSDENIDLDSNHFTGNQDDSLTMVLRHGGIGRFDERDAAGIINYLLQLLQDESAAFSNFENDFIINEVKNLKQIMNKLEQKLFSKQISPGSCPYLIIGQKQKLQIQRINIKYSSTNGKETNQIKAGTRLLPYNGSSFICKNLLLASPCVGGRNKLSATDSVLAYKSALLSKDRIVTAEDIKGFCFYQLGQRVENILIKKGVSLNSGDQQGYSKILDVEIFLNNEAYLEMSRDGELGFWESYLTQLLEEKSITWLPYRVRLQNTV